MIIGFRRCNAAISLRAVSTHSFSALCLPSFHTRSCMKNNCVRRIKPSMWWKVLPKRKQKRLFLSSVLLTTCFLFLYIFILAGRVEFISIESIPIDTEMAIRVKTEISKRLLDVSIRTYTGPDSTEIRNRVHEKFYKPIQTSEKVDCDGIISGNEKSIDGAKSRLKEFKRDAIDTNAFLNIPNCEVFKSERGYVDHPLSTTERDFPLAFGIVVHKDVELAERLLRAIYRPHNFYCFHVDKSSDRKIKSAFINLSSCFDNVFVVPNPVDVQWGKYTLLQSELLCMYYLWSAKSWKYYINLTGHEFPLKTNLEIVKILQAMDGANVAQARKQWTMTDFRVRWILAGVPPHNITPIVGSVHVALNRDFVDFCIHDNRSVDFQKYLLKTDKPDEFFFSSINHSPNLGIPGTFTGNMNKNCTVMECIEDMPIIVTHLIQGGETRDDLVLSYSNRTGEAEEYPKKPFFLRYKNWTRQNGVYLRKCYGKFQRSICILGIADIHKAVNDIGLFANKFDIAFEPLGLECLESWLNERTWKQYLTNQTIDVNYYSNLDQVKYQYIPGNKYSLYT